MEEVSRTELPGGRTYQTTRAAFQTRLVSATQSKSCRNARASQALVWKGRRSAAENPPSRAASSLQRSAVPAVCFPALLHDAHAQRWPGSAERPREGKGDELPGPGLHQGSPTQTSGTLSLSSSGWGIPLPSFQLFCRFLPWATHEATSPAPWVGFSSPLAADSAWVASVVMPALFKNVSHSLPLTEFQSISVLPSNRTAANCSFLRRQSGVQSPKVILLPAN